MAGACLWSVRMQFRELQDSVIMFYSYKVFLKFKMVKDTV